MTAASARRCWIGVIAGPFNPSDCPGATPRRRTRRVQATRRRRELPRELCMSCGRKVDARRNPGGKRKVLGVTLGIPKYVLTWGDAIRHGVPVPESARQPGPARTCRTPSGARRRAWRFTRRKRLQCRRHSPHVPGCARLRPGSYRGRMSGNGSHPNWLSGTASLSCDCVARLGFGRVNGSNLGSSRRDGLPTGTEPGNRQPGRKRGIARQALGPDGRCNWSSAG